jgi:ribulose 1,5-bisphosphate synthetase/thiazole synthase
VRTLAGVVVVGLMLAGLAGAAVRGVRRIGWHGEVDEAGRTTAQAVVEGLIVLAAVILGVVVVFALLS